MRGSLEIIDNSGDSTGVVGTNWTPETVPVVLGALYGITDVQEAAPTPAESGRVPDGQWTAKDASNQDVIVRLWEDVPFEETYAAEIGPGLVESEE